ncbi:hypothetical protein [Xanthobacter sp. ZOL 2024]
MVILLDKGVLDKGVEKRKTPHAARPRKDESSGALMPKILGSCIAGKKVCMAFSACQALLQAKF